MPQENIDTPKILSKNLFPVVGVGASAGGLEAFKKLVRAIPENSGMAYILVQHLHPDHSSSLPEILQRETNIPVHEIIDNVKVKPNQVYVIPANRMVVASDGILQLSMRPPKDRKNMPIDIFFSSLAEVHQSHAIGIILSGNGVDGTLGLKNIKVQGGITFAQDLSSAAYDAMSQSAINAEVVDFILAPEQIPQQLLELNRTLNNLTLNEAETPAFLLEEGNFNKILSFIRFRHGVDFTYYKQTTIRRRVFRRLAILRLEKIGDYLDYLKQNRAEQDVLFQDMLIPVTAFFRDTKVFENLCKTVFPEVIKNKTAGDPLRIWIAGCSTGEEAYSIAMCIDEYLGDKISSIKVQIFATDVSEKSIAKARMAIYNKRDLEGVCDSRLQQFFTKTEGIYQVKKTIREMCVFAHHNFIRDPSFSKIDFISCRNVLIYMEPFLQKKAFRTFHYSLNEKGYLLLGNSETTGNSSELFIPQGKQGKLYIRKAFPGKYTSVPSERGDEKLKHKDFSLQTNEIKKDNFQKNADDFLLLNYSPPGVIVNDQFDIVQFRGSTREFLEPGSGKPSLNVVKMAREGLSFELRNALHHSKSSKKIYTREGILINNGTKSITIEVVPLLNSVDPYFLVLFKDAMITKATHINDQQSVTRDVQDEKDVRIQQLEKDLWQGREDMRNITDGQEIANEELQSSNEELMSGSEELQSLNEELETSKEELQSTNEELITVNQELFERNEQFNQARLYAEAIVTTIHEPLLVISKDFKIISANKSFYKNFSITEEETVGKILFDLQKNQWDIPGLRNQILKIQTGREKFLEWEITYKFPAAGERTICLNAQPVQKENGENWVLLAFNDITSRKEMEKAEEKYWGNLKKILEHLPQITLTASPGGSVTYFNKFFLDYSGMTFNETLNKGWESVIRDEMRGEFKKNWNRSILTSEDFNMELQLKRKSDNMYRWHLYRASPIRNDENLIVSWVGAAADIHEQKIKEHSKEQFISIASHELKTPLTTAKAYVQLMQLGMEETGSKDLLYAQKANLAIDKLDHLIGELLDMSKIQNGKLSLQITTFDFNEMMSSAIEAVQFTSPMHHIITTGNVSREIKADKERLQQVVINLLTNAVKYSPKANKVFINMRLRDGEVKVSVKDSGLGIRKENFEKIFQPYYREEEWANHFQGLGIGLSICYEIIQLHDGKIWAENNIRKGSTFHFTIPT